MQDHEVDRYYRENPDCLLGKFVPIGKDRKPIARPFPDHAHDDPPAYVFVFDSPNEGVESSLRHVGVDANEYKLQEVTDSKKLINQCRRRGVRLFPNPHQGQSVKVTIHPDGTTTDDWKFARDSILTVSQLIPWIELAESRLDSK